MPDLPGPLAGLSSIADRYRGVLCDVWGVVHNGIEPHWGAVEALSNYRRQGGRVILITNAPRPAAPLIARLREMGIADDTYDGLISSGDATRLLIEPYRGAVVQRVGPAEDDSLFDGLDLTFGATEDARAVIVTDLDSDDDRPEDYDDRIEGWLARGLPLICANPDKVVEEGDRLVYCGGALADRYEDRGGRVVMAGKPYAPIYEQALAMMEAAEGGPVPREAIVAIGDSVRTDALGAAQFGVDLLFVTGSIHAEELDAFNDPEPRRVHDLVSTSQARMIGYLPRLFW